MARRLGISPLIVELTVVAYGTSAPEVVVGLQAEWTGHSELAIGNVIGSNIANLGLILGFAALLCPAQVPRTLANPDVAALALITLLGLFFLRSDRTIQRWEGGLLLGSYGGYLAYLVRHTSRRRPASTIGWPTALQGNSGIIP